MNANKPPRQLKLLDALLMHQGMAFNHYVRYTWRRGTETGKKARKQYEQHADAAERITKELRALLTNKGK